MTETLRDETDGSDIELRMVDSITPEERQRLVGWGENVFGTLDPPLEWRKEGLRHIMLYDGGQLMSHVGVLERHTVTVGDAPVTVSGIAGVVTAGDGHGRGYATRAIRLAHDIMRDEMGVDFGILFCFDRLIPFYERLGWAKVAAPVYVDQPSGRTLMPLNTMVLTLGERAWPAGVVELGSLPW
jgi:hypothetical protein